MGLRDLAEFAFENGGKQWARDRLFGEDLSKVQNPKKLIITDFLSDDVDLDLALLDIKKLKKDYADLKAKFKNLDLKTDFIARDNALKPYLEKLEKRYDAYQDFLKRMKAAGISGADMRSHLKEFHDANSLDDMDVAVTAMHHIIMGKDQTGKKDREGNFFHIYERHDPDRFNFSYPRKYFESRFDLYRYFALYQTKAATLAIAKYRALDTDESRRRIEPIDAELATNLNAQYRLFLEDMPHLALAMVSGGNKLQFSQPAFAFCESLHSQERERDGSEWKLSYTPTKNGLNAVFATGSGSDLQFNSSKYSFFASPMWEFTEIGSDDTGSDFAISYTANFKEVSGLENVRTSWQIFEDAPEDTKIGTDGQNRIRHKDVSHVKIGRHTGTADISMARYAPPGGTPVPLPMESRNPNMPAINKPFSVKIGLVHPTKRDSGDEKKSYDKFVAYRLSDNNNTGKPGHVLVRHHAYAKEDHFVTIRKPDGPAKHAVKAADSKKWQGGLFLLNDLSSAPAPAHACRLRTWGVPFSSYPPEAWGVWKPKFWVRYFVMTANRTSICPTPVVMLPTPGCESAGENYMSPTDEEAVAVVEVQIRDPFTQSIRLFRQFYGDPEPTEVLDYQIMDSSSPKKGEYFLMDLGGFKL